MSPTARQPVAFSFVGNHPALDFVNTAVRGVESLTSFDDVVRWLEQAGLLGEAPAAAARAAWGSSAAGSLALTEALALRDTIRTLLRGPGADPALIARLNAHLGPAPVLVELAVVQGRLTTVERLVASTPQELLRPVATAARDLLLDPRRRRVTACRNPDCGRLFLPEGRGRVYCTPRHGAQRRLGQMHVDGLPRQVTRPPR